MSTSTLTPVLLGPPHLIVCAANRYAHGVVILGVRHYDALMHKTINSNLGATLGRHCEQGFVDNRGAFLTRTEAWAVAFAAGQILRRVGGDNADGGTLYSENLY